MNFYDILGVDREADRSEIRAAYRSLARRYHPDVNDHPRAGDQFRVLSRARDVLTDETERSAYDRLGHADYVAKRLDSSLPDVEMEPRPGGEADAATEEATVEATSEDAGSSSDDGGPSSGDGSADDTGSGTVHGSTAEAGSSDDDPSTERGHVDSRTGAGAGGGIGAGSAGPASTDATTTEGSSQEGADATTAGSGDRESDDSTASGDAEPGTANAAARSDTDRATASSTSSSSTERGASDGTRTGRSDREQADAESSAGARETGDAATTGGSAGDVGPSPTSTGGAGRTDEAETSYSTPPTPGGPSGPERLRNDQTRTSRRLGSPLATVRAHFGASHRWLVVVAAAGVYGAGLAGYLLAGTGTLGELRGGLTAGTLAGVVGAVVENSYELPGLLGYGLGGAGGPRPAGVLVLLGASLLPVALALAVYGLRRHATWRPSWLHVLGALGPLASVGLTFVDGVPRVPVVADLLLLVVLPAVVVASFLLNRLVLVAPLRRREDLGLP